MFCSWYWLGCGQIMRYLLKEDCWDSFLLFCGNCVKFL